MSTADYKATAAALRCFTGRKAIRHSLMDITPIGSGMVSVYYAPTDSYHTVTLADWR